MKIEISTLLGKPHIFLRHFKLDNTILEEPRIQHGQEFTFSAEKLQRQPEIAIAIDLAVERNLVIEDGIARFTD